MKFAKKKTKVALIVFFLMLTIIITAIPLASTHTPPWKIPTNAFVICTPSTIGLGQYTTIVVWVDRYSPTAGGGAGQRWDGFKIDIMKPDGTNQTIGPFKSSSDVGSDAKVYTPDKVGNYTIVFSWPGDTVEAMPGLPSTSPYIGDFFEGSTSEPFYLTVQQEPVTGFQETPLPTEWWQRPITDINRGMVDPRKQLAERQLAG
jgi:hypothetical protein